MTVIAELTAPGEKVVPSPEHQQMIVDKRTTDMTITFETPKTSVRPDKILFGLILNPQLRIKKPLRVDISRSENSTIAYCPALEEFGYGPNISAALDDLAKTLSELFFSLEDKR